jgi:hypothetical protein
MPNYKMMQSPKARLLLILSAVACWAVAGVALAEAEVARAELHAPSAAAVGTVQLQAVVEANSPWKLNAQYPTRLDLDPPPTGVEYPARRVKGLVVAGNRGTLSFSVLVKAPGSHRISGVLRYSVCDGERCLMEKAQLATTLATK